MAKVVEPVAAAVVPVVFRVPLGFLPFSSSFRESPYRTIEAFLGTSTHCLVISQLLITGKEGLILPIIVRLW
jgi:hypothetical protein